MLAFLLLKIQRYAYTSSVAALFIHGAMIDIGADAFFYFFTTLAYAYTLASLIWHVKTWCKSGKKQDLQQEAEVVQRPRPTPKSKQSYGGFPTMFYSIDAAHKLHCSSRCPVMSRARSKGTPLHAQHLCEKCYDQIFNEIVGCVGSGS